MSIGRYANPYKCVSWTDLPSEARMEPLVVEADDGGLGTAMLYTTGDSHRTVVCFMHPRADMSRHYAIPWLLEAGYAAFGQNSRWLNNDSTCVHEILLRDVAAGLRLLRERGFRHIVLVGNSGGGSLFTFYLAQALTPPPGRLTDTAAGDPCDLNAVEMPVADGLVLLAAHNGEGRVLMDMIDPSVTDENDPLSCDPELDLYRPENGYRVPPEPSRYSPEFVARYRQAQRRRVARIDAIAREWIDARRRAREEMRSADFDTRPAEERLEITRRAVAARYLIIYRTEADPRALDPSLDPSDRDTGTLFSRRPDLTNYMEFGFGRICTPQSWLSTWSGLSSRADLLANAPLIHLPSLVIYYTGDNAIFPSDARATYYALGADDRHFIAVPGDHYGFGANGERTGAEEAMRHLVKWLRERFPA